ncbi:MAG: phosphoadenosine phosphosulfate reductase family protein [Coriobacteriia bacterium]|nr:phosphoadenosine phosphosulfate reductase family protein [Coriobacteriia bacterium]
MNPDLFGETKDETAIALLRASEPPDGYYLAFSGGKDSTVIYDLAVRAGVKFDAHYSVTTVDPPELVYHIRKHYLDVKFDHHGGLTMWQLIVKKRYPPTRVARYCCEALKEGGGVGRVVVTGIRWAESAKRSKRRQAEVCYTGKKSYLNPIISWSDDDVWGYIRERGVPYCALYDEGFKRLGCVMCPMQGRAGMLRDADRWPKIAAAYKRAIRRSLNKAIDDGLDRQNWRYDSDDMWDWWLSESVTPSGDQNEHLF